jgi:SpoVK/Ycf46/Vps4 family AAA+-type ATPase
MFSIAIQDNTMPRYSRKSCALQDNSLIVHLWLLRLLVPLGAHRRLIESSGYFCSDVAQFLGLEGVDEFGEGCTDFDPQQARAKLFAMYRQYERRPTQAPAVLKHNVSRLAALIGLAGTDCRILELAVMLHSSGVLEDTVSWLGELTSAATIRVVSVLLRLPEPDIRRSLGPNGLLEKSGLVSVRRNDKSFLSHKLELLTHNFADIITSFDTDPISLLRGAIAPGVEPELCLDDYRHIASSLDILRPYLRHVAQTRAKGANILLYGAPGTGKSQLARVLAADIGCQSFEIVSEDEDGGPISGKSRLQAFRAAQSMLAGRQCLVVFDEIEDIFGNGCRVGNDSSERHKHWLNRTLESNPVPAFWVSNSTAHLDPAFVRRFDIVLELPIPPASQRQRILEGLCKHLISTPDIERIAQSPNLAPAVVARTAHVIHSIASHLGPEKTNASFELLVNNTLRVQGHAPVAKTGLNQLPDVYDPDVINSDVDLADTAQGLMQSRAGRLCLYGAPGTGKTAYGQWLARQMDMPLHVKRASDLISKWVGETEKNIANAFRQAKEDCALLLIDEVDSFLQDRRGATRSWEVTEVNEMLTQMEAFPGVFIASTNLMDNLDQAALRRFDLKARFDFLKPEQSQKLLQRYCRKLELAPAPDDLAGVARLHNLAPGDFAAVERQSRFRPLISAAAFAKALATECALKENARRQIGFL